MPEDAPELHPDLTPQDIVNAIAALRSDSPTQFTINTMRKHGGQLPNVTKQEINDLFTDTN